MLTALAILLCQSAPSSPLKMDDFYRSYGVLSLSSSNYFPNYNNSDIGTLCIYNGSFVLARRISGKNEIDITVYNYKVVAATDKAIIVAANELNRSDIPKERIAIITPKGTGKIDISIFIIPHKKYSDNHKVIDDKDLGRISITVGE